MYTYLKKHEAFMIEALKDPSANLNWLSTYHQTQILFIQHERLIHLLITLFLLSYFYVVVLPLFAHLCRCCFYLTSFYLLLSCFTFVITIALKTALNVGIKFILNLKISNHLTSLVFTYGVYYYRPKYRMQRRLL